MAGFCTGLAQGPAAGKGIWAGVYSDAQAKRGLDKYTDSCSGCHKPDLMGFDDSDGFAAQLKGPYAEQIRELLSEPVIDRPGEPAGPDQGRK